MMKSVSAGDQRASDDSRSKSDSVDGEKVKLRRMDSQFKITTPDKDCKVLHNLFTPAAMVGVPDAVLTPREEIKDKAPHVVIVTNTHEALWWHMDTLKTNAPDRCSKEAMFEMTIVNETDVGRRVRFKSHIMDQYLVVTYNPYRGDNQSPFTFKLSSNPDGGVTSTFLLGTDSKNGDEPNYMYLGFQSTAENNTPTWYFWYVDGDEVKIRKAEATEIFNAMSAPC